MKKLNSAEQKLVSAAERSNYSTIHFRLVQTVNSMRASGKSDLEIIFCLANMVKLPPLNGSRIRPSNIPSDYYFNQVLANVIEDIGKGHFSM